MINYYEIIIKWIQSFNANNLGYRYLRTIIKYWHMLTPTVLYYSYIIRIIYFYLYMHITENQVYYI